jgi:tRNA pseudouridine13 synthase
LFNQLDEPACAERMAAGEVHPTAPMPGTGGLLPQQDSAELEQQILDLFQAEIAGLQAEGVEAARRATRLPVRDLDWVLSGDMLTLSFRLPVGSFATSVLAEILELQPLPLESFPEGAVSEVTGSESEAK